ncbi:MAG: hypothetical protein JW909_13060 [Planctomycetes bacterium]|nr:hypothetical protein [Planctomycetota bacterium]
MATRRKPSRTQVRGVISGYETLADMRHALAVQNITAADFYRALASNPDLGALFEESLEVVRRMHIDIARSTIIEAALARKQDGTVAAEALRAAMCILSTDGMCTGAAAGDSSFQAGLAELVHSVAAAQKDASDDVVS